MAEGHEEALNHRLSKMQGQLESLVRGQMRIEGALDELSLCMRNMPERITASQTAMDPDVLDPINEVGNEVREVQTCRSPAKSPRQSPSLSHVDFVGFQLEPAALPSPVATEPGRHELGARIGLEASCGASSGGSAFLNMGSDRRPPPDDFLPPTQAKYTYGSMASASIVESPSSPRQAPDHRNSSVGSRRSRQSEISLRPHEAYDAVRKSRSRRVDRLTRLKQSQEQPGRSRRTLSIHPTSWVRIIFDVCGLTVLSYDAVMVPLVLAWDIDIAGIFAIIGWIAVSFWIVDMVLNCVTGYVEDGILIMNAPYVLERYIKSGFLPDLVLIVCELAGLVLSTTGHTGGGSQLIVLRAARLAKISRAVRIMAKLRMGLLQKLDHMLIFGMNRAGLTNHMQAIHFVMLAVRFAVFILWLNHVASCLLYWLSTSLDSDTGKSWMEDIRTISGFDSPRMQYLQGLYWAAAAMFSGSCPDRPSNSWEAIFAELYLVSSALFVTCIAASLAARLIESQLSVLEQTKNTRKLNKYLLQHKTDPILAIAIRNQFFSRMRKQRDLSEIDLPFLRVLSARLRTDLRFHLYGKRFLHTPFFRICETLELNIIREVCFYATHPVLAQPGEEILLPRSVVEHAFILLQGKLQYLCGPAKHIQDALEVEPDQCICELAIYTSWKAVGTLQSDPEATAWTEVLKVSVESFLKLIGGYPHVLAVAANYAQKVCEFLRREDPDSLELSDMDTFIPCDIVLASLNLEARSLLSQSVLQTTSKRLKLQHLADSEDLMSELGGNVLMKTLHGEPYCIRRQVELYLTSPKGLVLVLLAEWKDGTATPRLGLPSMLVDGDDCEETVVERLKENLGDLLHYIEIGSQQMQVVDEGTRMFAMHTKCVRIVQHGVLDLRNVYAEVIGLEGGLLDGDSSSNVDMLDENGEQVTTQATVQAHSGNVPEAGNHAHRHTESMSIFGLGWPKDGAPRAEKNCYRQFGAFTVDASDEDDTNGNEEVNIYGWITCEELSDIHAGINPHGNFNELLFQWMGRLQAADIEHMRLKIAANHVTVTGPTTSRQNGSGAMVKSMESSQLRTSMSEVSVGGCVGFPEAPLVGVPVQAQGHLRFIRAVV